jgi:hypothetical protein
VALTYRALCGEPDRILIQESWQVKDSVTGGASRSATERYGEQFAQDFLLLLKRDVFDPPKHLVLTR